jgi:flagellar biosynthetic protein FliR
MITVTSAQLDAWIVAFLFPLARILGLLGSAPVFNNAAMPRRVRLMTGLAIALALVPALPPMPAVPAGSWIGLAILAQQMLIGILMGFALRIAFAAVDIAGEMIGLQMGLSFAAFVDPQNAGEAPVVGSFLALVLMLLFLALDGHLLLIAALVDTFHAFPLGATGFSSIDARGLVTAGRDLFAVGLQLALPVIAALLLANLALGVLTRTAPQLNLFAVGFPITLLVGMLMLLFALPFMLPALEAAVLRGLALVGR